MHGTDITAAALCAAGPDALAELSAAPPGRMMPGCRTGWSTMSPSR